MERLIKAFGASRIVYAIPYLRRQVVEKEKIDRINRQVLKQAIALPITTPNGKLLHLGLDYTSEKLIEAQRIALYELLMHSETGRAILDEVGINYTNKLGAKKDTPYEIRNRLPVLPVPENYHLDHYKARRAERAKNILNKVEEEEEISLLKKKKSGEMWKNCLLPLGGSHESLSSGGILGLPKDVELHFWVCA